MTGTDFFLKNHNYQGRTDAAQCGLFTQKSVPVIFEPPCITRENKIKKNEMGRVCRTYGVKMRFIQGFGEGPLGREAIWKT
jgi:hypothetical protein